MVAGMVAGSGQLAGSVRRALRAAPLGERQFALLFAGQSLSAIGNGITGIALAFAVLNLTHSPTDLGLVLAAGAIPMVAFLLVGGVWADRLPRRGVMLSADAVRALAQAGVGVLLLTGDARLWQLIVAAVLTGTAAAFFQPAASGLTPATVSPERLQGANAYLGMLGSTGSLAGPLLGGVFVATLGTGQAFLADAATFVWSAGFLAVMRPRPTQAAEPQHFLHDLADGFREVRSRTWLWTSILAIGLTTMMVTGPEFVLGPVIARSHWGGAIAWGSIALAFGIGLLIGNASALRFNFKRPLLWLNLSYLLVVPETIAFAIPAPLPIAFATMLVSGLAVGVYFPIWDTLVQERVPPEALSRVSSYDWMGSLVFLPLGLALAGPVASLIGLRDVPRGRRNDPRDDRRHAGDPGRTQPQTRGSER
jgi:MFS family permease